MSKYTYILSHFAIISKYCEFVHIYIPVVSNFQTVDLVKNYNKEVKMREESYVPRSVEEHLQISARTSACHLLACTSLVGMDEVARKDSFDWVSTMPEIVQRICIIVRLLDDIMTYEITIRS
jgi:hypothetical protein